MFRLAVRRLGALTDEQIAKANVMRPMQEVADKIGVAPNKIIPHGHTKAKLPLSMLAADKRPDGKLILVTAINPTKAGEGKTTTSIGLHDGLRKIGKNSIVVLREPSLGPVFGMKGGAAGGGYAQVVPMDEINLHFTGDFHAISSAHNLLSAIVDNHIYWQKEPKLDVRKVSWRRVVDMNDRALRKVNVSLGGLGNGYPREDGFDITVASEVMAVFCLATSHEDLQRRLGSIVVGKTRKGESVRARDLNADGAMAALLKDALNPNLVQTLEGNPAIVHGGPFANIAHGCNSLVATRAGLKMADYVVTEAGFGADLGAEKFLNIKCRKAGLRPEAVVIVATMRALKLHGGAGEKELTKPDVKKVQKGCENLRRHIGNIRKFGLRVVVCINALSTDSKEEHDVVKSICKQEGATCAIGEHHARGGAGAVELAQAVVEAADSGESNFKPLYSDKLPIHEKIETIAKEIYGASAVSFVEGAADQLAALDDATNKFPVCVAKTQYSFSDDPLLQGAPSGHTLHVRELRVSHGAEFVVALAGQIMTMPGLPKVPSAESIKVVDGAVHGLF